MNIELTTRLDKSKLSALLTLSDKQLAGARSRLRQQWEGLDLDRARRNVKRLQARIVKALQKGQTNKVKVLQGLLVRSLSARILAVERITKSRGARTPGIDNQRWNSSASKMAGALSLWKRGYRAQPLRRVYIAKAGSKKKRPLGIPTIRDRAMQALYLQALEPIAETTADPNSYGFRKYRGTMDAIEQAFICLSRKTSATWILDADIKGCFDHISHNWMLNNIPMDHSILRHWLKCGVIETKGNLFPTTAGTPQGGIASPCLCNMVLDGLEAAIKNALPARRKINFIRYADDFIVTAKHRRDLENTILPVIKDFLATRGLTLSEEKTQIRHIREGFDFLGQNIRKYAHGKYLTTPSKKNVKAFLHRIRVEIKGCRGQNLATVISRLNPKIRGWANYHRNIVAQSSYAYVDHQIDQALWRFLRRTHSNKSYKWIRWKYVKPNPTQNNQKMLTAVKIGTNSKGNPTKKVLRLYSARINTERIPHIKVRGKANPYDPSCDTYFRWLYIWRKKLKAGEWKPNKWSAG